VCRVGDDQPGDGVEQADALRQGVEGVGDDQPGDGVEQADALIQGVEGVRDHDPRDHLRDQDGEQGPTDPAERYLGQGVRAQGVAITKVSTTVPMAITTVIIDPAA
jgi:hypothetical protein